MKNCCLTIILAFTVTTCFAQLPVQNYNFDFELNAKHGDLPEDWLISGNAGNQIQLDSTEKQSGNYSLLIRRDVAGDEDSFLGAFYVVPAIYQGNEISLKAYIKAIGVTQPIGLMLRIDGESGDVLQFDNMTQRGITGSEEWTEYSVTLELPEEAEQFCIAIFLNGSGKLWVDNFSLTIDDKVIRGIPPRQYPATADTLQFKNSSAISIDKLTKQQIENLNVLGKIWGMMKYYHPAIAEGNYNWDYELFRTMPKVINATSNNERNAVLLNWVKKYGELAPASSDRAVCNEVKIEADLLWTRNKERLGNDLVNYLIELENTPKGDKHYYIAYVPYVGNPTFKNEDPYKNMVYPDAGYRLLSLYRYWNIIQYYFPYRHLIGEDWNEVLPEFIPMIVDAKNAIEYQLALAKLITRVNDGHAYIFRNNELGRSQGSYQSSAEVSFIEGKAVVAGFYNDGLSANTKLTKGDIITKVNGKSVETIIEERKIISSASNEPARLRDIGNDLLRSTDTLLTVEYESEGVKKTVHIPCYGNELYNDNYIYMREYYIGKTAHKTVSDSIGYIYMAALKSDSVDVVFESFKNSRGIIIDLRCYPHDMPLYTMGQYLVPEATEFTKFTNSSIAFPGQFCFGEPTKIGKNNIDYYKGKIAILLDESSISSAEFHAMAFQTAPRAKVFGSTTAGADGNLTFIALPGGVGTGISGIGVYYPDGRETQRVGIIPDVEIKPTIKGFREGRDEVLEKAILWINEE